MDLVKILWVIEFLMNGSEFSIAFFFVKVFMLKFFISSINIKILVEIYLAF